MLESAGRWDRQRMELIEGEVIAKMPKNRLHSVVATLVRLWLERIFGGEYVDQEASIDVAPEDNPTSEPEPDLIVLSRPSRDIKDANPQPADIRLVVEISDSSVGFDLTRKAPLYARAGLVEYWVADIPKRRMIVHRDPRDGRYQSVTIYDEPERVSPLAAPDREFLFGDVFPS